MKLTRDLSKDEKKLLRGTYGGRSRSMQRSARPSRGHLVTAMR